MTNNKTDVSPQAGSKLQALTADALKTGKAAMAAKQKVRSAKARLKAAKQSLKEARAALKEIKKLGHKTVKHAKRARKALQVCLDQIAKRKKRERKRDRSSRGDGRSSKGGAAVERKSVQAMAHTGNSK
jgi:hypothetical protein